MRFTGSVMIRKLKGKSGRKIHKAWDKMKPILDTYGGDTVIAQVAHYDGLEAEKSKSPKGHRIQLFSYRMRRFDLMLRANLGI